MGKESACNAEDTGDMGSVPGSRRVQGGENSNPLQYSCLKNPMDRGAWQATVQRVTKSQTHKAKKHSLICGKLIYNKDGTAKEQEKDDPFDNLCSDKLKALVDKKIKSDLYLIPCTKI